MSAAWFVLIAAAAFLTGLMTAIILEIRTGWIWQQYQKRRQR